MSSRRLLIPLMVPVVLLLAACGTTRVAGPRTWTQATERADGSTVATTVTDRSGRVVDLEFDPPDADPSGGVTVAPGKPTALDVRWTGGSCDATTMVDISAFGAALEIAVKIENDGRDCDAMGLRRVVRLTFAEPVAPGLVQVTP